MSVCLFNIFCALFVVAEFNGSHLITVRILFKNLIHSNFQQQLKKMFIVAFKFIHVCIGINQNIVWTCELDKINLKATVDTFHLHLAIVMENSNKLNCFMFNLIATLLHYNYLQAALDC